MYTSMFRKAMLGDTATLALDFSAGTLPTAVTFTRADSTARATFINASGYVQTVASAGAARFDYSPTNIGEPRGLLIEGQTVNLARNSSTMSSSTYTVQEATLGTGSANDPSNSVNAPTLTPNIGFSYSSHLIYSTVGVSNSTAYTLSVYAKANGYNRIGVNISAGNRYTAVFDLTNGTFVQASSSGTPTGTSYAITPIGTNGWYRCSVTMTTADTTLYPHFMVVNDGTITFNANAQATFVGDTSKSIYLWGAQLELGSGASSYIPTTTASLTRLADDAVIRSTAWTGLYSKPGTIVVEYYRGEYGAGDRSVLAIDTAATKHIHLKHANASAGSGVYNSAGLAVCAKLGGNVTGLNKAAFNWSSANPSTIKYALNGNATVVSGSSDIGATLGTWMTIGSASTTGVSGSGTWEGYLNNSIKSVKYYSELLSEADMIAKTT
jgi:hypothetical protein